MLPKTLTKDKKIDPESVRQKVRDVAVDYAVNSRPDNYLAVSNILFLILESETGVMPR